MINVAMELLDKNIENADFSFPQKGNPGVGGSEYLFLLLGYYLCKNYPEYNVTIFHYNKNSLPEGVNDVLVNDEDELIGKANEMKQCILIHQINKTSSWYKKLKKTDIKDVPWAHCYIRYPEARMIFSTDNVKRIVFVSKEEYDSYIDDDVITKADFIYNMMNTEAIKVRRSEDYDKSVTYMGSIVQGKAFHLLAEIWPEILKQVPDANLNVIGSGKLYDRNKKMGEYGIADEEYERRFMPFLTDDGGMILPSVHFYGLLKTGKEDVFCNSAVGVVNPSGKDETFCLSAVEMELCGLPVVTIRKYGLCDTVDENRTGLLFKNKQEFVRCVVKLLQDRESNKKLSINCPGFVIEKFDAGSVIKEWNRVLKEINCGKDAIYCKPRRYFYNDMKLIKMVVRFIRFKLHFKFVPSVLKLKYIIKRR